MHTTINPQLERPSILISSFQYSICQTLELFTIWIALSLKRRTESILQPRTFSHDSARYLQYEIAREIALDDLETDAYVFLAHDDLPPLYESNVTIAQMPRMFELAQDDNQYDPKDY
jgi:hypothetical protein